MIKNESHYRRRISTLEEYRAQIKKLDESAIDKSSIAYISDREALTSFVEEIEEEIKEYESYKQGHAKEITCNNFSQLSDMLIKARIAQGLSQEQLAEKAELHAQQIQKYEANDYQEVKFATLIQIAYALDLCDVFKAKVALAKANDESGFLIPTNMNAQLVALKVEKVKEEKSLLKIA